MVLVVLDVPGDVPSIVALPVPVSLLDPGRAPLDVLPRGEVVPVWVELPGAPTSVPVVEPVPVPVPGAEPVPLSMPPPVPDVDEPDWPPAPLVEDPPAVCAVAVALSPSIAAETRRVLTIFMGRSFSNGYDHNERAGAESSWVGAMIR